MITKHQEQLLGILRFQLFGGERIQLDDADLGAVLREAAAQTVYTAVFPYLRDRLRRSAPERFVKAQERFLGNVAQNTANALEHGELHALMTRNGVPYAVLKGFVSAAYYPEATLRDMGDVDFLVRESDFARAEALVTQAGFTVSHGEEADSLHIAYRRGRSIWEQHRSVNGIPDGAVGKRIRSEIDRVIDAAEDLTLDGVTCRVPDAFHHGLIMLLHVVSHMTSEGVGLRHLCDWAVFVDRLGQERFAALFTERLRGYGLLRFAQILTRVSERYLGVAPQDWAQTADADETLLEEMMTDILSGGNFGKKDQNRYREIKYIADRGARTVDDKPIASQAFAALNRKTRDDYPFARRHRILLPAGWIAEGGKYIGLLVTGKRKRHGTAAMLREAAARKSIYNRLNLFEADEVRR